MASEFFLPDIGEGLTEATIVEWLVAVGETVDVDGPLVEVETDKAVTEIPAPAAGVLLYQGGAPGDTISVGSVLAVIGEPGESYEPDTGRAAGDAVAAPIVGSLAEATETLEAPAVAHMLPLVRKLAAELGVDAGALSGTGPGGRVTEDDVRQAAAATTGPVRRVAMTPLRRAIAEGLSRSWREIPHVTVYDAAEAANLLAERDAAGKPPLEAVVIRRIVPLLAQFPACNAAVVGSDIVEKLHYDIGVAIDTPDGLMVGVVRGADGLSLDELAAEISRLGEAARDRTATVADLRGQTFTVSNIGAVGGGYGTPIIPYGTTAILSVGRAKPAPVVRDGELTVGRPMPLSLSYDHRALDGATGRAFLGAVVAALEAPA